MTGAVVLALDGTHKDERAIAVAESVAELTGAALTIVHVGRGDAWLDERANRVRAELGDHVRCERLPGDDAAAALIRHASETRPLLVAMSTRAAGGVERAVRGSVADRVMRECPSPVLLVPPGSDFMAGKHPHFARVLVPLDGSDLSARALEFLLRLPSAARLEYALLEVVRDHDQRAAAEARLEVAARRVRAAGARTVDYDVAEARDPARAIADVVRDALVDLIVMSSRGQSGVRRLALGSVAEGVIRASEVPVLLITPTALEGVSGSGQVMP